LLHAMDVAQILSRGWATAALDRLEGVCVGWWRHDRWRARRAAITRSDAQWFVDPASTITVVALTNTALEGMSGKFPGALRTAVYEGIQ